MRHRGVWWWSAAALLLSTGPLAPIAGASSGPPASIEERVKGADTVVVARVRAAVPSWHTTPYGDRIIVTRAQLEVEETLKGGNAAPMVVEVPGGTLDGYTLRVSGQPVLRPGERAVFFLERAEGGVRKPHRRGEGVLKLDERNAIVGSPLRLDDVRRVARPASGRREAR